jgi:predicted amidohydrolase
MLMSAALVSGLLLAAAHRWRAATALLLVALLPVLSAIVATRPGVGEAALAGTVLGGAYAVPLAIHLRFPPALALGLSLYLGAGFVVAAMVAALAVVHLPPLAAALVSTVGVVACDRLTVALYPAWGTAQSWVRPLSRWPWLVRASERSGQPAAMLAIVLPQAFAAVAVVRGEGAIPALLAAAALVLVLALLCVLAVPRAPARTLRVAAIGWDWQRLLASGLAGQPVDEASLLIQPIARAAQAGARLVVTPETGLNFTVGQRTRWIERLGALAAEHDITLVVGYLDEASRENRAGIFVPGRGLVAEYAKANLVYAAGEHLTCTPGRGEIVQVDVDGVCVGVLICHDDNFTGPARRHARAGSRLLAIPTNDWAAVKSAHLENVPWRALENGLAIVRGASSGISAVIAPDGGIRERFDHTLLGHGLVVGDVPVRE